MKEKDIPYEVGDPVSVFIELPYNQSDWLFAKIIKVGKKRVTVKLNHFHHLFPEGIIQKSISNIRRD